MVNGEIGSQDPSSLLVKVSSMKSGQAGPNPAVVMSSPFFLPTPLNSAPFMLLVWFLLVLLDGLVFTFLVSEEFPPSGYGNGRHTTVHTHWTSELDRVHFIF